MGWGAHSIHITNKLKIASYSAMEENVFGKPITDDTLTPLERAKAAYKQYSNKDCKDVENARQFVENLISKCGDRIKTGGLFYNATGGPLTFITRHDYQGNVFKVSYPNTFQNGQWFAFLHVQGPTLDVSSAAVVYSGVNDQGDQYDYMCSWSVPRKGENKVYTEVADMGHFRDDAWGPIEKKMGNSCGTHNDEYKGCESSVKIMDTVGTTVWYQAILTLKGALNSTDAAAVAAHVLPSISASVLAADTAHAGTDQAAAN